MGQWLRTGAMWGAVAMVGLCAVPGCRWTSMGQNTMGVQLYQQGQFGEALQQFQAAQRTDPSNADTYYNLAATYHRLGVIQKDQNLIEQAERLYNQCLDIDPNHTDCHRALAVLLVESDRPDRAFALLKNWASANPTLAAPRVELARMHQEFGQLRVAEQMLDEALTIEPNNYLAWTERGRLREEAGDIEQALRNYNQSLALNGMQPQLYQRTASLNLRLADQRLSGGQLAPLGSGQPGTSGGGTSMTSQGPGLPPRY
jgi:Flp pilus assembly protein TadD